MSKRNERSRAARGRAGMAVPLVLGVLLLVGVLAVTSSVQASATRGMLERSRAERKMRDAACSAVDEACASLEESLTPPAFSAADAQRDLSRVLPWPSTIEPVMTRQNAGLEGAKVSSVEIRSSPWIVQMEPGATPGAAKRVRETGILRLAVRVRVPACGSAIEKTFVICRYVSTRVSRRTGTSRLDVSSENLYAQDGDRR